MIKHIFLLSAFFIGSNWLLAQENQTPKDFNLQQAIDYAYQNNTEIQNSLLDIQDAEQQILERRAIGLPQVNGKIEYQYFPQVPKMALPDAFVNLSRDPVTGELPPGFSRETSFQLKNNFNAGVTASALVFDGSYLTGLKAARLFKTLVQKQLETKRIEVRNQVTSAYLPVLLIDENIQLIDNNTNSLQQLLNETQALYKEGFVEQLDVDRLELSLANLTVERENLTRQRETVANTLKFIIGYPEENPIQLNETIESLLEQGDTTYNAEIFDVKNKYQHQAAELNIQFNDLNVELNQRGYLPNFAVFANYQYQYLGDNLKDGFWAPSFVVGGTINVPIFDGFDKRSKIERAKIGKLKAQNQLRLLEESMQLEVNNTVIAFENAMSRVRDREKNVQLAEKIYDTTKIKYREGVGSSIELVQAEQALFTAQNNYTQAVYNAINAKMDLDAALGK